MNRCGVSTIVLHRDLSRLINNPPLFFSAFVNSNPVEGISDGTLQMTFLELRQVHLIEPLISLSIYLFSLARDLHAGNHKSARALVDLRKEVESVRRPCCVVKRQIMFVSDVLSCLVCIQ